MTSKNVLTLALDALEWAQHLARTSETSCQDAAWSIDAAITAIKQAQAQPAQPKEDATENRALKGLMLEVWACTKPNAGATTEQMRATLSRCLPHIRGLALPAPKQAEPVQPSSQKTLALAQEGMDLHDHNAPEYIICAELMRLNKALSGAPTPPADMGNHISEPAWQPIESAPYETPVLAWLHLPKNPIASACVIASRVFVEKDEPEHYGEYRRMVGCWWANGMYYPKGHVTAWAPLPTPPEAK